MNWCLKKTSSACPEQYDVFKGGKHVGYIRLRRGVLSYRYPNNHGETIYVHQFEDEWKGYFENEEERTFYLDECKNALLKAIKEN